MVWKVYEETYRKVKGYTFIEKSYHSNLPEYYFMVKKGGFTGCLLKSYDFFTKAEKDKAIADYLNHKIKAFKRVCVFIFETFDTFHIYPPLNIFFR